MKKADDIRLWASYIELNTTLMHQIIEYALKNEKMSKLDARSLNRHLDYINRTTNHIKELAEQ